MSSAEDDRSARGNLRETQSRLGAPRRRAHCGGIRRTESNGRRIQGLPDQAGAVQDERAVSDCRVIEKDFPDGVKEHRFIRAETHQSLDSAIELALAKGKQIIDQQGDRIFI